MESIFLLLGQIWTLILRPGARRAGELEALMADTEAKVARHILECALALDGQGLSADDFDCRLVWRGRFFDFVFAPKRCAVPAPAAAGNPAPSRLSLRGGLPSRRPRLPRRWRTRAQITRRFEHRRNRRRDRTFLHAAPIAPAIRAPRIVIPPW